MPLSPWEHRTQSSTPWHESLHARQVWNPVPSCEGLASVLWYLSASRRLVRGQLMLGSWGREAGTWRHRHWADCVPSLWADCAPSLWADCVPSPWAVCPPHGLCTLPVGCGLCALPVDCVPSRGLWTVPPPSGLTVYSPCGLTVCWSPQDTYLQHLVLCIEALVSVGREDCRVCSLQLLQVLVTVMAVPGPPGTQDKVRPRQALCVSQREVRGSPGLALTVGTCRGILR